MTKDHEHKEQGMKNHTIEIVKGVEGVAVYINDLRVAGDKPWGGGTLVASFTVPDSELKAATKRATNSTTKRKVTK